MKAIVSLIVACVAAGCVNLGDKPYPASLGQRPTVMSGDCANISGEFENDPGPLVNAFWNKDEWDKWTDTSGVTHYRIEQSPDTIAISAWRGPQMLSRQELHRDSSDGYLCTSEGVSRGGGRKQVDNLLGFTTITFVLFKTDKGSLVLEKKESLGGLALGVLPVHGTDREWFEFRSHSGQIR